jgi:hypothetical protein
MTSSPQHASGVRPSPLSDRSQEPSASRTMTDVWSPLSTKVPGRPLATTELTVPPGEGGWTSGGDSCAASPARVLVRDHPAQVRVRDGHPGPVFARLEQDILDHVRGGMRVADQRVGVAQQPMELGRDVVVEALVGVHVALTPLDGRSAASDQ